MVCGPLKGTFNTEIGLGGSNFKRMGLICVNGATSRSQTCFL